MTQTTEVQRPEPPAIEDPHSDWRSVLDQWARHQWRRFHHGRDADEWPPPWALPVLVTVAALTVWAVIAGLLVPLVKALFTVGSAALADGADWLHGWVATEIAVGPIRRYLDAHAVGLPVSPATLWWTWCAAGVGTFVFATLFRANAARIGWTLFGIVSVAMVWAASTGPSRPIVTGIAGLWWIVLSLFALRSSARTPRVRAYLPDLHHLASIMQRRRAG
jgi:hypothetical protein